MIAGEDCFSSSRLVDWPEREALWGALFLFPEAVTYMIERSPCTRYSSKMGTLIAIQPLFQPGEVAVITPTLQVRKPRHRQLK